MTDLARKLAAEFLASGGQADEAEFQIKGQTQRIRVRVERIPGGLQEDMRKGRAQEVSFAPGGTRTCDKCGGSGVL